MHSHESHGALQQVELSLESGTSEGASQHVPKIVADSLTTAPSRSMRSAFAAPEDMNLLTEEERERELLLARHGTAALYLERYNACAEL